MDRIHSLIVADRGSFKFVRRECRRSEIKIATIREIYKFLTEASNPRGRIDSLIVVYCGLKSEIKIVVIREIYKFPTEVLHPRPGSNRLANYRQSRFKK